MKATAPLRSIVYLSTAAVELSLENLESLLVEARQVNQANAISGVLLYSDGNIAQCFEGPEDAMALTYARIRASRRHRDICELMNEPVVERSFEGWTMGLAETSRSEHLALSTAQWKAQAGGSKSTAAVSPGLELMQLFWERNARRF